MYIFGAEALPLPPFFYSEILKSVRDNLKPI